MFVHHQAVLQPFIGISVHQTVILQLQLFDLVQQTLKDNLRIRTIFHQLENLFNSNERKNAMHMNIDVNHITRRSSCYLFRGRLQAQCFFSLELGFEIMVLIQQSLHCSLGLLTFQPRNS